MQRNTLSPSATAAPAPPPDRDTTAPPRLGRALVRTAPTLAAFLRPAAWCSGSPGTAMPRPPRRCSRRRPSRLPGAVLLQLPAARGALGGARPRLRGGGAGPRPVAVLLRRLRPDRDPGQGGGGGAALAAQPPPRRALYPQHAAAGRRPGDGHGGDLPAGLGRGGADQPVHRGDRGAGPGLRRAAGGADPCRAAAAAGGLDRAPGAPGARPVRPGAGGLRHPAGDRPAGGALAGARPVRCSAGWRNAWC